VDGIKSKTKQGGHVGYFYAEIDFTKPVIVVEGEIDFLSLAHIENVIGLQGVANLSKLVL
jgi:DNA primase